ncbi:MAG TPA: helix-turn-helix transcriptional regulator [Actinomycetota bacterium]|nr:helix-turn-helix transcriptional regulator [Actinomycetota bacterium]
MGRTVRRPTGHAGLLTTGQRLSKLIVDRGIISSELADSLGIQESTLANFREGHRNIPSGMVVEMARELDTNVAFLLESSEDARPWTIILEETRLRDEAWQKAARRAAL